MNNPHQIIGILLLGILCMPATWTDTINPSLSQRDDDFTTRQAAVLLEEADIALKRFPPQIPEPLARRLALRLIDGVAHTVYAPMRPPLQTFYHRRMEAAITEMENTQVTEGALIWKLYNHGFVIRTKSVTLAFDLYRGAQSTEEKNAEGKDVRLPCPDFPISDALAERLAAQCDVLFSSHAHRDHMDPFIFKKMTDAGKPVVATEQVRKYLPDVAESLTYMERKAHVVQDLPVQNGAVTLKVVVYPGNQGGSRLCNNVLVTTPEGLSFAHNGDQINGFKPEEQKDFLWIDKVKDHFKVDVVMTNCWMNNPLRYVRGFDPQLVLMGHEIEMGHEAWDRMPYWGDGVFIESTYPQLMNSEYPILVMAWGESYRYIPREFTP
jgi:L-ascorbate metabolism protein UlaG (beta-lactamase superfamily)